MTAEDIMDLQERAFYLTLKWLELTDTAKNISASAFALKYLDAHQEILRELLDNEPPESFDAASFMNTDGGK